MVGMGRKPRDMTGVVSGRLTAVRRLDRKKYGVYLWVCKCLCGKTKVVTVGDLHQKRVKSCGCLPFGRKKQSEKYANRAQRIKTMYAKGEGVPEIAKKFHLSRQRVYQILHQVYEKKNGEEST